MDKRVFFEKVALMSEAQKDFFRTRSNDALRKSKALEAEIERLRDMGYTQQKPKERNLFSPTT